MTIYINDGRYQDRDSINIFNFEVDDLRDISTQFINFLRRDKYLNKSEKQNSFILWHIAMRKGGKTGLTFIELNQLLKSNPERFIQFYKVPELMVDIIYQKLQEFDQNLCEEYKGRFECINKIRKIRQNGIVVIDEGLIGANAKEALKVGMRNLGKYLSKSRHSNNIIIINSVNLNILSEFRDMIDIAIYKRVGSKFIMNNERRDPILDKLAPYLTRLRPQEGFLFSDYWDFEKIGVFTIELDDYCPWFDDDISRYHQHTSADVAFEEEKKLKSALDKIAKQIISEVGDTFQGRGKKYDFEVWFQRNHEALAYDYQTHINDIYKRYVYFLKYADNMNSDMVYEEEEEITIAYEEQEQFHEFCERNILQMHDAEYSREEMENIATVAKGLARGDSYRDIDSNYPNIGYHFIRTIAKWLRSEANQKYGLGYLFERWMAFNLGVPEGEIEDLIGGYSSTPDLVWKNKIWTFKFRISRNEKSYKFRQSIDFAPEYSLAKKKGKCYYLAFMDPKWSLKVDMKEIDPINDPEEVIVKAPEKKGPMLKM
jgi:hypothetical protein